MKTRELIAALQKVDPSGDAPVCVGNHDIYFVDVKPYYYDGSLQQLVHDESKCGKQWSIIGAKIGSAACEFGKGTKIDIVTMSVQDLLHEFPDMPVQCSGYDAERVEKWRAEGRALADED